MPFQFLFVECLRVIDRDRGYPVAVWEAMCVGCQSEGIDSTLPSTSCDDGFDSGWPCYSLKEAYASVIDTGYKIRGIANQNIFLTYWVLITISSRFLNGS